MESNISKREDGPIIDRELNPPITFLKIEVPRYVNKVFMVNLRDQNDKEVGFVRELTVNLHIKNGMTCTGKRIVVARKNPMRPGAMSFEVMVDKDNKVVEETFTCPCVLDGYETQAEFVAFDAAKNPTDKQLRDYLGCRICGRKTDVMYQDKDGAKCEKHRGQATEILMLDSKG